MTKSLLIISVFFAFTACNDDRKVSVSEPSDLPDTTNVIVNWDTLSYILTSTRVWLSENQIDLSLRNENSYTEFDLELQKNEGQWKISSISEPSPTDCLFVSSQFRILNQSLNLNKAQYNSGDRLQGTLELLMLGRKAFVREPLVAFIDKRKWDTIRIQGIFSTRIK